MILINESKKKIYLFDEDESKLKELKWDYKKILTKITSKFTCFSTNTCLIIENIIIWKHDNNNNINIIFINKNKHYIIDKKLVDIFWFKKIIEIIYWYKWNQRLLYKWVVFDFSFNKQKINKIDSIYKLYKLWIKYKSEKINWYYISYWDISLGLWDYHIYGDVEYKFSGIDKSLKLSRIKAISEWIERISWWIYSKINEWKFWSINKKAFNNYCTIDYNENKKIKIVETTSLSNNKTINLPAEIIYYPYKWVLNCNNNSNWMATHNNLEDAISWWILELIERDAFLLFWLLKKWWQLININSINNIIDTEFKNNFFCKDHNIYIVLLNFDNIIPVILWIIEKNWSHAISLWAGFSFKNALNKCLVELIWSKNFLNNYDFWKNKSEKWDSIWIHIYNYLQTKNSWKLKWIKELDNVHYNNIVNIYKDNNLSWLINYYNKIWINNYYFEFINDLNKKFKRRTVRVISDWFLPIYFWIKIPKNILYSKRLRYWKKYFSVTNINRNIHPLW